MGYYFLSERADASCDRRLKEENARLQQEADDRRYEDEHRRELQQAEWEEARRERKAAAEEALRTPKDWPDAFHKAHALFARESRSEISDNAQAESHLKEHPEDASDPCWQPQSYFTDMLPHIATAEKIYNEVMADVERQIQEMRESALKTIADRARTAKCDDLIVQALNDNQPDTLTNW